MISPGATLRALRERKPLVHQITNYVVMNETANATLALGALPVMAHAGEEVEEMARLASALVLNIGTLSEHWVEAMLLAGGAANARQIPVVLDPVGAGATEYRTATAHRILGLVDVTVLRGNAGEVATLVGAQAEVRGVESMGAGLERGRARARSGAQPRCDRVGHRPGRSRLRRRAVLAVSNGHELLATVTGYGLHVDGDHRLLPRREARRAARGCRRGARRVRRRGGGRSRRRRRAPGTFHARLYDAL